MDDRIIDEVGVKEMVTKYNGAAQDSFMQITELVSSLGKEDFHLAKLHHNITRVMVNELSNVTREIPVMAGIIYLYCTDYTQLRHYNYIVYSHSTNNHLVYHNLVRNCLFPAFVALLESTHQFPQLLYKYIYVLVIGVQQTTLLLFLPVSMFAMHMQCTCYIEAYRMKI